MGEDAKFRHELKHYINYSDYLSIRNRLRTIMHIDKNADSKNEYRIRSLYFDNIYDKALMEKVLEVKFDEFLPQVIQDIIQVNERRATSVSKYEAARIFG